MDGKGNIPVNLDQKPYENFPLPVSHGIFLAMDRTLYGTALVRVLISNVHHETLIEKYQGDTGNHWYSIGTASPAYRAFYAIPCNIAKPPYIKP